MRRIKCAHPTTLQATDCSRKRAPPAEMPGRFFFILGKTQGFAHSEGGDALNFLEKTQSQKIMKNLNISLEASQKHRYIFGISSLEDDYVGGLCLLTLAN